MTNAYVVSGTLTDSKTVRLDEPLPVSGGRVRVTLETAETSMGPKQSWADYFAALRARQAARGHVPRSAEDIQAQFREERESWGD